MISQIAPILCAMNYRLLVTALFAATLLSGCASDPVMSGKAQDWVGHDASELRQAWGEPERIIPNRGGEVWQYVNKGDFVSPEHSSTQFGVGRVPFGGISGGADTVKDREHASQYENKFRFFIKDGKVKKWFESRSVDGRTVWEDH